MWDLRRGLNSLISDTLYVISSDPLILWRHVGFTSLLFKALSDQEWMKSASDTMKEIVRIKHLLLARKKRLYFYQNID